MSSITYADVRFYEKLLRGVVATVAVVVNEESSPRFSSEEFDEEKNFSIKPKNTPFVNAQIKARKIFVNVHKPPD